MNETQQLTAEDAEVIGKEWGKSCSLSSFTISNSVFPLRPLCPLRLISEFYSIATRCNQREVECPGRSAFCRGTRFRAEEGFSRQPRRIQGGLPGDRRDEPGVVEGTRYNPGVVKSQRRLRLPILPFSLTLGRRSTPLKLGLCKSSCKQIPLQLPCTTPSSLASKE